MGLFSKARKKNLNDLSDDILLTVVIPFFNEEKYLDDCISSVIKATIKRTISAEIILVDDNSTDKSSEIAKRYSKEYPFIQYLSVERQTRGPGHARNMGIRSAKGEYISFVDSDDMVKENMFELMLASIRYHDSDLCVCNMSRLTAKGEVFSVAQNRAFAQCTMPCTTLLESPSIIFGIFCTNTVVRSSFMRKNNIYFPEDTLYEDFLYCLKIASLAHNISIVNNIGYIWRVGDKNSSITRSYDNTQNFIDRTNNNRLIMDHARRAALDHAVIDMLQKKILMVYADTMLADIEFMSREHLENRISDMADFFRDHISEDALNHVPLIHEQIWRDILKKNVDKVRKDVLYKTRIYNTVPIVKNGDKYDIVANPLIIDIDRRDVRNDFDLSLPVLTLDKATMQEHSLNLHGWLYFRRIPTPDLTDQKLQIHLYNDVTGDKIPLPTQASRADRLMETLAPIFNYDDCSLYSYDYSGSGFNVVLDLDELIRSVGPGDYLLMISYDNPLKSGQRVLRGMQKAVKAELYDIHLTDGPRELDMTIDPRNTLQIRIRMLDRNLQ